MSRRNALLKVCASWVGAGGGGREWGGGGGPGGVNLSNIFGLFCSRGLFQKQRTCFMSRKFFPFREDTFSKASFWVYSKANRQALAYTILSL